MNVNILSQEARMSKQDIARGLSDFIGVMFSNNEALSEDQAGEYFSDLGSIDLTDLFVEAERQGGLTQELIMDHVPEILQDDGEWDTVEGYANFWQLLVFATKRYKWIALPGMGNKKKTRKPKEDKPEGDSTTRSGSITDQVIKALGGEEKAIARAEELRVEHGGNKAVVKYLQTEMSISGLKDANYSVILSTLRKKQK